MGSQEPTKVVSAAVRLICRYSNGLTKSFMARAVSYEKEVLRVLTPEQFETGIQLTAVATFFTSAQPCRVMQVIRSPQPGYFIVELRPLAPPKPASAPAPAPAAVPVNFSVTVAELAARLEGASQAPLYQAVFARATAGEKKTFAQSVAAAVFLLLARKGQLDARQILNQTRKN